ncbi:hypothetical protein [Exiguobacterium sp.]|uniref:hypothetical protein n=1 Tax=Exiguobacterium sp. TaxID=44751 RepID=UPI002896A909|nr:hypothetical protein [Exiguobacterium sp.]
MRNELMESERGYLMLSHRLLEITSDAHPYMLETLKKYLNDLDRFDVFERTLYVAELLEVLDSQKDHERFNQTIRTLKSEAISDAVSVLFKQYKKWII